MSTELITLSGEVLKTHQYSVTEYERDLSQGNKPGKDDHGHQTSCVFISLYLVWQDNDDAQTWLLWCSWIILLLRDLANARHPERDATDFSALPD